MQKMRKKRILTGSIQKKILLLLVGGLTLGLVRSPKQYFKVVRGIRDEWKEIDRRSLEQSIRLLYKSHLVSCKYNKDGTMTLVLSREGRELALREDIDNLKINVPDKWDGKWRVVMFDVPQNLKKVRDSVRWHLKEMGFLEYQKSVFIFPYPARKQIEFVIEFYNCRRYVRQMLVSGIDNHRHLKKRFNLK